MAGDSSEHIKINGCNLFLSQVLPLKNRTNQKQQQPWQESLKELAKALSLFVIPWWLRWERICLQCRRSGFNPWVRKVPWRREWLPTPVFLSGEFYGQRSLAGYNPQGHREADTTEQLSSTSSSSLEKTTLLHIITHFFPLKSSII